VLIFDKPLEGEVGESLDFLCYQEVVKYQDWTRDCQFDPKVTTLSLKQQNFEVGIKSLNDSNNLDSHIVIDNTPFPQKGALRKFNLPT
jgi:hypothetical protein